MSVLVIRLPMKRAEMSRISAANALAILTIHPSTRSSVTRLAKKMGISRRYTFTLLQRLEEDGKIRRRGGAGGRAAIEVVVDSGEVLA